MQSSLWFSFSHAINTAVSHTIKRSSRIKWISYHEFQTLSCRSSNYKDYLSWGQGDAGIWGNTFNHRTVWQPIPFHFVKPSITWLIERRDTILVCSFQLTEYWQNSCDIKNISLYSKSVLVPLGSLKKRGQKLNWKSTWKSISSRGSTPVPWEFRPTLCSPSKPTINFIVIICSTSNSMIMVIASHHLLSAYYVPGSV